MIKMDFRFAVPMVALVITLAQAVSASELQLAQADSATGETPKKPLLVDLWRPGDPG